MTVVVVNRRETKKAKREIWVSKAELQRKKKEGKGERSRYLIRFEGPLCVCVWKSSSQTRAKEEKEEAKKEGHKQIKKLTRRLMVDGQRNGSWCGSQEDEKDRINLE